MLFRGQNMLGYRHYADDAVEYFVQKSVANGIDIIRIFDALNDIRNLRNRHQAPPRRKAPMCRRRISYTTEPGASTTNTYVKYAKTLEDDGRGLHLHQGYGRPAHALCHLRAGQGAEEERSRSRSTSTPTTPPAWLPWCHAEGHRSGRRHHRHRHVARWRWAPPIRLPSPWSPPCRAPSTTPAWI